MYDIKLGQGCGIKATMLTPTGGVCDLRRARYIAATLLLPSNRTMNCADISFNEVTNAVYVRLLGTRELTTPGRYGIVFNVKLEDKTMYSTPAIYFANVSPDAATGYHELTLSLSLTVVNFPDNVSYTGASPKISDKNTWLVYDDNLNAYVDTGVEVDMRTCYLATTASSPKSSSRVPRQPTLRQRQPSPQTTPRPQPTPRQARRRQQRRQRIRRPERQTRRRPQPTTRRPQPIPPPERRTRQQPQQAARQNQHRGSSTATTTLSMRWRTPTVPSTNGSNHSKERLSLSCREQFLFPNCRSRSWAYGATTTSC